MRFLLVEDEDDHADLVSMSLSENRVANQIDRVADGEEAIRFLFDGVKRGTRPRPDAILLDLRLPRIDGHDVLQRIKQDPSLKTIPVVVLTTSQAEADRHKAYSSYANSYLCKPLDFDKFHQMVKDLCLYWTAWNQPPPSV